MSTAYRFPVISVKGSSVDGEVPAEHIRTSDVVDGAVLTPGELLWRVQGVVANSLINLPHSGPV